MENFDFIESGIIFVLTENLNILQRISHNMETHSSF